MMKKEITEINIDLIKMLRAQGKNQEANWLIRAFQKNKKANLEQLKREIKNQEHKKYVHKNKEKVKKYQKEYHKTYNQYSEEQ